MRKVTLLAPISLVLVLGAGCGSAGNPVGQTTQAAANQPIKEVRDEGPTLQLSPQAGMPTQSSIADLVEHVAPTVVNITTTHVLTSSDGAQPFDMFFPEAPHPRMPRQRQGAGTG